MGGSYNCLIQGLISQFTDDPVLQRDLRSARSLEAIVEALALSYARLIEVALSERRQGAADGRGADLALSGAQARESAMRDILAFFERPEVVTARVKVSRSGPHGVRVRCTDLTMPARA